jgi:6-phosphofructokinase 2
VHQLGGTATAVYPSGGLNGGHLKALLDLAGVDQHPVPISGETRENWHIHETATGVQYRFNMPGPQLTPAETEACIVEVESLQPSWLVLSGSLPQGADLTLYAAIIRRVQAVGAKVLLDVSGPSLAPALAAGVFLVKPNQRELAELTGRPHIGDHEIVSACRKLLQEGAAEAIAVSLAAAGCLLITAKSCVRVSAPPVRAVSKVGAGDSMVAGTVHKLSLGWTLEEAVRYGVAAGTAAVLREGTQLCRLDDTERLFAQMVR